MITRDYPSCCTGSILVGFGRTSTGDHSSQLVQYKTDDAMLKDVLDSMRRTALRGEAFLSAAINSDQVMANRVLRKAGFKPSKWMTKRNHRNTKVRVWLWHAEEWGDNHRNMLDKLTNL